MLLIVVFIIFFYVIYSLVGACNKSHVAKSGRRYYSRDQKTAEILDVLRDIAVDLIYDENIDPEDSKLLKIKLQNTSFRELINQDPDLMAWNYDKGRELGFRIYNKDGTPLPAGEIINSLLHELAHSLCWDYGHHAKWQKKNKYLQDNFHSKYVNILINKTFLSR
jgi:hypothetical protein|tara:strand:+ start:2167 stop:2661 length:495 start_codon:yes stop_codon:yes gene_type:complete